ncbi:MAG: 1,4-dihydroxy-2-naphthoate polyprenyltransferase [Planctomycetota bacterium]
MLSPWILAARPKTLIAGISPIAIGTVLAWHAGQAHLPAMLFALLGAVSVQIGTNFCNDYFDFFQGADTADRKGPTRAVQAGLISPRAMLFATTLMFVITGIAAYALSLRAGWPFLLIGVLSILFGVMYTAGRFSLAYQGLGDPFVFIFFGPVAVAGTYYVQTLELNAAVVIAGFGPGALATGLLIVNNLRDVEEDRKADKRTLVVRFGITFSRLQYALCILSGVLVPIVFMSLQSAWWAGIASLVGIPGLLVVKRVWASEGVALRPCLGMTAGLLMAYTLLFCVGVGLS